MTGVGITLPNKTHVDFDPSVSLGRNRTHLPVLFDTGATHNYLTNDLYFAIGALYPDAKWYRDREGQPAFKVPCDAPLGTLDYTFGETTIKVPFQESLDRDDVSGFCNFGFRLGPQDEGKIPYILGDTFMRGAYMVFDLDNDEFWMGEKADCGSNIVAVGKGKDAVPVVPGCGSGIGDKPKPTKTGYKPPPAPTALERGDFVY